jgi:SAM-dependent methyltransferase
MSIRNRCQTDAPVRRQLLEWYRTPLGHALAEEEQEQVRRVMPDLFGYHMLQIGACSEQGMMDGCRVMHRAVVDRERLAGIQLQAGPDSLPVATGSVAAVLLHHTLEFADDPHLCLREADRVLLAGGHLLVLGFNPFSSWGLRRLVFTGDYPPWCGRFFSVNRVRDWLALLGFDVESVQSFWHYPPLTAVGLLKQTEFLERWGQRWWPFLGAAYLIVARKQVIPLTPVKPRWRPRRGLVGAPAAERSGMRYTEKK